MKSCNIILIVGVVLLSVPSAQAEMIASTFLGGSGDDGSSYLNTFSAVGEDGSIYVTGSTESADFPVLPGCLYPDHQGGWDVYVAKYNSDLSQLLACTFIGGQYDDEAGGIAIDPEGNVYLGGNTRSSNFPVTSAAYDTSYNGSSASGPYEAGGDVFICKFNADLSQLLASTLYGGSDHEYCRSIALNANGEVYVTGASASDNLPTSPGCYAPSHCAGGYYMDDAYVAAFDGNLENLLAGTYLGGSNFDFAEELALDAEGNVYLCGWVMSNNFPTTPGCYDPNFSYGYYDGFVSLLSGDCTQLLASTFLGGTNWDFNYDMILDNEGNVYVTGHTASSNNFPTTAGCYDPSYNGGGSAGSDDDAYLSKFSPELDQLLASTFIGGLGWELGMDMLIEGDEYIFLTGMTGSSDFPVTPGAFDEEYAEEYEAFILKMDLNLTTMSACSYLGGFFEDEAYGIAFDPSGNVVITGHTASEFFFPVTSGAQQPLYGGGEFDVFVSILTPDLSAEGVSVNPSPEYDIPQNHLLMQAYPNPFNQQTAISFKLQAASEVSLKVFDITGRKTATLTDGSWQLAAGEHSVVWDAASFPSGIYFIRLTANGRNSKLKLVLLK